MKLGSLESQILSSDVNLWSYTFLLLLLKVNRKKENLNKFSFKHHHNFYQSTKFQLGNKGIASSFLILVLCRKTNVYYGWNSVTQTSALWNMNWKLMKILYPSGQSINEKEPEFISVIKKYKPFFFDRIKSLCILIAKNGINSLPQHDPCPLQRVFAPTPTKRWSLFSHPLNLNLPCDLQIEYARNYMCQFQA